MDEDKRVMLYRKRKCKFTKKLRRKMTPAEKALWLVLRNRNSRGIKFSRQVNIGPYVVDFLCREHKIVIETDGGIHNDPDQKQHDKDRDAFLSQRGFKILRLKNKEVLNDIQNTLQRIHTFIENTNKTVPSPARAGEG